MTPYLFYIFILLSLGAAVVAFLPHFWQRNSRSFRLKSNHYPYSSRRRLILKIAALLSLTPIVLKLVFILFPLLEARLMPLQVYPIFQREFWLPFAVLFFALSIHLVPLKSRRFIGFIVVVLVGLVAQQTAWHITIPSIYQLKGTVVDGVCRQSSSETCGAAASVTLLNSLGIQATEGEMARLSMSAPGQGVSPHLVAFGLQKKLAQSDPSAHVRLMVPEIEALKGIRKPFLAGIRFSATTNHMICVLAVHPNHLIVGDPISPSPRRWTWEKFKNKWSGVIIVPA